MRLSDPAFRAIFEDSPVGIVVVDKDLVVVDVNAAYCDMLGRTEAEMMGSQIPEVTHPEDRGRDIEAMPKLLSGELPYYRVDKRYVRKDGEIVWARIVVTAMLDPSGQSRYAFSMAQPISDERALRSLLPACPSCHRVHGPDGEWVDRATFVRRRASAAKSSERCPDCSAAA